MAYMKFKKKTDEPQKDDFQEQTEKFIELLNKKAETPEDRLKWVKEWTTMFGGFPKNGLTGNTYQGINSVLLSMEGREQEEWLTFKQMQEKSKKLGIPLHLKKGTKGNRVYKAVRVKVYGKDDDGNTHTPDGSPVVVGGFFRYKYAGTVFNVGDIDGYPLKPKAELDNRPRATHKHFEHLIAAMQEDDGPFKGIKIEEKGQDRAFYRQSTDSITMPRREQFQGESGLTGFYATMAHEIGHSTGHPSRLKRDLGGGFGTKKYAREELVAEFVSMYLGAKMDLPYDPFTHDNHAAYMQSWMALVTEDKMALFNAANQAREATNFVLDRLQSYVMRHNLQDEFYENLFQKETVEPELETELEPEMSQTPENPAVPASEPEAKPMVIISGELSAGERYQIRAAEAVELNERLGNHDPEVSQLEVVVKASQAASSYALMLHEGGNLPGAGGSVTIPHEFSGKPVLIDGFTTGFDDVYLNLYTNHGKPVRYMDRGIDVSPKNIGQADNQKQQLTMSM